MFIHLYQLAERGAQLARAQEALTSITSQKEVLEQQVTELSARLNQVCDRERLSKCMIHVLDKQSICTQGVLEEKVAMLKQNDKTLRESACRATPQNAGDGPLQKALEAQVVKFRQDNDDLLKSQQTTAFEAEMLKKELAWVSHAIDEITKERDEVKAVADKSQTDLECYQKREQEQNEKQRDMEDQSARREQGLQERLEKALQERGDWEQKWESMRQEKLQQDGLVEALRDRRDGDIRQALEAQSLRHDQDTINESQEKEQEGEAKMDALTKNHEAQLSALNHQLAASEALCRRQEVPSSPEGKIVPANS